MYFQYKIVAKKTGRYLVKKNTRIICCYIAFYYGRYGCRFSKARVLFRAAHSHSTHEYSEIAVLSSVARLFSSYSLASLKRAQTETQAFRLFTLCDRALSYT